MNYVKILIATHNPAKLDEIKQGLRPLLRQDMAFLSLNDIGIADQPEETGKTFEENSLLKAQWYGNKSLHLSVADDGGLMIPVLNNEPGVQSHRWPGHEADDKELVDYTLFKLKKFVGSDRLAYLQTCITFYDPKNRKAFSETEKIEGYIARKPSGKPTHGYPYRALFVVKKYVKYYDELTHEEHQSINHRLHALERLSKKISIYLLQ